MKSIILLITILLVFTFDVTAKPRPRHKQRVYKCNQIGIQKIKNKKFKVSKITVIDVKTVCINDIPVRSPRYCHH